MNPLRMMFYFRIEASFTLKELAARTQKSPLTQWSRLRFAEHYTNEATEKFNLIWEEIMGKGKSNGWQGTTRFCAISLDTAGKELAKKWLSTNGKDIDVLATDLVRAGWKSTFTWDADNDCFIASSTQRYEDDKNYDVCVTSRAGTMWDALMLNVYKINVLYKDQKLPTERAKMDFG